jgi:hypothetical protein
MYIITLNKQSCFTVAYFFMIPVMVALFLLIFVKKEGFISLKNLLLIIYL